MGGKSSKTKITRYHMSVWWGLCIQADYVLSVEYGEKVIWQGRVNKTGSYTIYKPDLYGGDKKEGGVIGRMTILMGDGAQVLPNGLAKRLGYQTGAEIPGARGWTSLFFTGMSGGWTTGYNGQRVIGDGYTPKNSKYAFYWCANSPYLKSIWATVQRIPRQLDAATAEIPRIVRGKLAVFFVLDTSGSMAGTKLSTLKTAMSQVIETLKTAEYVDIGIGNMLGANRVWSNASASDLDAAISYVQGFAANGGTNYLTGILPAVTFFQTRPEATFDRRVNIFLTDGEPDSASSAEAARNAAANMLASSIRMYGVNVELTDTRYTAMLDNASGGNIPIIAPDDVTGLTNIFYSTLGGGTDANPAHIIYECLTNSDWGLGENPSNIDTASFVAAARTLFAEALGISIIWDAESAIEDFVNNILAHINGVLFSNPRNDGLLTLRLVRDDYDRENLRTITPDNAMLRRFSRKAWGDTINEVQVNWTNPDNESTSTVILQDDGNIAKQGSINSSTSDYPGVRSAGLAARLAERDLRAASSPLSTGEASVDRSFYDITPMEVVKLHWPEYGVETVYMRVTSVTYGPPGDAAIPVTMAEDIFSFPQATYTDPQLSEWEPPPNLNTNITGTMLMPAPYYGLGSVLGAENPNVEYPTTFVAPLASSAIGDGSTFDVYGPVTQANGSITYELVDDTRPYMFKSTLPVALVAEAISVIPQLPSMAENTLVILGGVDLQAQELALVASVDDDAGTATLWRGVLDTTPKAWAQGAEVWYGDINNVDAESTPHTDGASVTYRFKPEGSSVDAASLPDVTGTARSRASRPLRPANATADGVGFGPYTSFLPDLKLAWAVRNRLTEDPAILKWSDATVPRETGQTTSITVRDTGGALLDSYTGLTGTNLTVAPDAWLDSESNNRTVVVEYGADRDGEASMQAHKITVNVVRVLDGGFANDPETGDMVLDGGAGNASSTGDVTFDGGTPSGIVSFAGSTSNSYTTGTSQSVAPPSGAAQRDLLLAVVMHRSTLTAPTGWTLVATVDGSDGASTPQFLSIYSKTATANDLTNDSVWTQAASDRMSVSLSAYRRPASTPAVRSFATNSRVTSSTDIPYATLTVPTDATMAVFAGSTTIAATSGVTTITSSPGTQITRTSVTANRLGVAYLSVTPGQALSGAFTSSISSPQAGQAMITVALG